MRFTDQERQALVPTGVLRATINLGNPILATMLDGKEVPEGISVDIARALASTLEVDLEMLVFDGAGKAVNAVSKDEADIGFFAVDPLRGEGICFTPPYILIEGAYLVRGDSEISSIEQVDRPGVRICVGSGSAYDLYLSRSIEHAEIVRTSTSPMVVDVFLDQQLDVAAGVRQQLEFDALRLGNLSLLPGRFMVIQQAMGTPKSRGPEVHGLLTRFVEEMKTKGFVSEALNRHRIQGAAVAPAQTLSN